MSAKQFECTLQIKRWWETTGVQLYAHGLMQYGYAFVMAFRASQEGDVPFGDEQIERILATFAGFSFPNGYL